MAYKRSGGHVSGHYRNGTTWVSEHYRSGTTVETSREERIAMMALFAIERTRAWEAEKAARQEEWEERQRQKAIKQAEYEAKKAEWEEREIQRATKQAEYEARKAEREERERERAIKQAEYEERERKRTIKRAKQAEYEERQKKRELAKENELMNKIKNTSPAFRRGDDTNIKTIIVLSAPGQEEEKAGRPAAGQTGTTLQEAIEFWHNALPTEFPSKNLDDYTIVNAVEDVHYKAKTGRTEGTDTEVCDTDNMKRINAIIADTQYVVALGYKAQLAVSGSIFNGKIYSGKHPSMNALNTQYSSQKLTPNERGSDRIRQWATDVLDSLETQK
jgi:hypothetical protein